MRCKKTLLTSFSRALFCESLCLRPDNESQLTDYIIKNKPKYLLARGSGLSYNDSCLNRDGKTIDTQRLNHLISFDSSTGLAQCQGGVRFKDLFLLHPDFIPPVLPGTVHATVAGGIAHDIHGKNNHLSGSFGHHIQWMDLLIKGKTLRCTREENSDLFHATCAGLGLTGIITRVGIHLKRASRFVQVDTIRMESFKELIDYMPQHGVTNDYQVAWLDLLNPSSGALLSLANHCAPIPVKKSSTFTVPKIPLGLIGAWNMKLFNRYYCTQQKSKQNLSLEQFNNPLDKITHWNRIYGPKGLIQFQAVFDIENANDSLNHLIQLIRDYKATPTLAVLKLFTQAGEGLLSFCKPGFTLAIDFINNEQAQKAIIIMNQYISETNGRVYLAKDLLLKPEEFKLMYKNQEQFSQVLAQYKCDMHSILSQRLRITS